MTPSNATTASETSRRKESSLSSRVFSLVRTVGSWLLATIVVCVGIGAFYYYHRGSEEIRVRVESELAKAYPQHAITVGSARFLQGEGLQLREVSVVQPGSAHSSRAELVYLDEAMLYCNPTIEQLLQGQIEVDAMRLRGLSLYPSRAADGEWNFEDFLPAVQTGKRMPRISIENALVQVTDRTGRQPNVTVFRDIQATLTPPHSSPKKEDRIAIWLRFANEHVRNVEVRAKFDPNTRAWVVEDGKARGLLADSSLYRRLLPQTVTSGHVVPGRRAAKDPNKLLAYLNGLRGELDLSFTMAKGPEEAIPRFHIKGGFKDGRFDAPRFLANPVTDIKAENIEIKRDFDTVFWQIQNVTANYGRSPIVLESVRSNALSADCDLQVVGVASNLNCTRELVGLLTPKLQQLWSKYEFLGQIDVDHFDLRRINGLWSVDTDVTCLDVSLNCAYFPYPVHKTEGRIIYRHKTSLDMDLSAATNLSSNPTHVHISSKLKQPGVDFNGNITVSSHGWMRLDEQLREAVGPKVKQVLADLDARGEVSFKAVLTREPGGKLKKDIAVDVRNAGAKYVTFPYPLRISQGRIRVTDDIWTFRDFVGQNDSCVVRATANWYPAQRSSLKRPVNTTAESIGPGVGASTNTSEQFANELRAEFIATNIPCDAELREALPAGPKQIWEGLRPAGHVDYAKIDLVHRDGMKEPEINVLVKQLQTTSNLERRGLHIQPTWFPLSMDRVTGVVKYNADGTFVINEMRAEHGYEKRAVPLQSSGGGVFRKDGTWEVRLDRVYADGFATTPELTAALPSTLSESIRSLQFQGTLSIDGQMHFSGSSQPGSFVNADWRAIVGVDSGKFILGDIPVTSIFGQVGVAGQQRPDGTVNWGRASVASLMCKGVQATEIESPFQVDEHRLVYGANAFGANDTEAKSPHLTARLFGGVAIADGEVQFTDNYPFGFRVAVQDFNVADVARDFAMPANMSGRGQATLEMTGNSEGSHTWKGNGKVTLRDANLAKLPALISLVNELRQRTRPDTFTSSDITFNIDGAYLNLEQFDLHGASLSLKGQGWIAMDRRLKLAFYTLLGGEKHWLPGLKRWSKQWWQIVVSGTIDSMRWSGKALPALNDLFLDPPQTARATTRAR